MSYYDGHEPASRDAVPPEARVEVEGPPRGKAGVYRANLDRLIATLEALEPAGQARRFGMEGYFRAPGGEICSLLHVPEPMRSPDPRDCGAAACLAGWCQMIGAETDEDKETPAFFFAQSWLGLDDKEAEDLFFGDWAAGVQGVSNGAYVDLSAITIPQALDHLRGMRAGLP